jgi:hypothetical protein
VTAHCHIGKVTFKGNIRALPWVTMPTLPARVQPNRDAIRLARDLLGQANSGRCQGFAVAWLDRNGWTYSAYAGGDQYPASLLVGSMAILMQDIAANVNKVAASVPMGDPA